MNSASTRKDSSMKSRIRQVWKEGLVRRVIAEKEGRRVVDIPLTAFLVAAVLAPWLVALGGIAGILLGYQFRVEREELAGPVSGNGEGAPVAPTDGPAEPGTDSVDRDAPDGTRDS